MANLSIKQIPEALLARLKRDAAREGRSLNKHVIHVLEHESDQRDSSTLVARILEWRASRRPERLEGNREVFEGLRDPDPNGGRKFRW